MRYGSLCCLLLLLLRAGLSDQSMALAFLVDSAAENPLVQKLAAWVAQGAAPPPLYFSAVCVSTSPWDAGLRASALTTYDSSTASLTPDLKLTAVAQPKPTLTSKRAPATLLTATFTPEQAGKVASSSKGWESVPSNSSLVFAAKGSGEVSIAAALNFTPADLLPFPTYRGLWVQRAVLVEQAAANSSSGSGSSLRAAEEGIGLGKIVTVAVQVHFVFGGGVLQVDTSTARRYSVFSLHCRLGAVAGHHMVDRCWHMLPCSFVFMPQLCCLYCIGLQFSLPNALNPT
jgi:hypothetical protein